MKAKTLYIFKMTAMVRSMKVYVALKLSAVYVFNIDVRFCIVKKNDSMLSLRGICAPILSDSFHILITLIKVLTVCI